MCEGNWSAAEAKPSVVQALIDKEISAGWVHKVPGGREEALKRWPSATAIGKLNLVEAPGKDPRLVLDSAVCQVNTNCSLPEAVQLPTVSDVCSSFQPSDPRSMWIGASLDFKAAHKQVKVRPADQGLLLFEFSGSLYGYVVCHFGARFSAYWWQRLGALLLRIAHNLLSQQPHRAWLYVDDLLAALLRSSGDLQLALLVVLFVCLKSPISWKKAALGDSLIWCGWKFNFRSEAVSLEPSKLVKLAEQIQSLLSSKKVHKKALQSCLGLLNWATSISHHLRSYTAPLYSDLRSPPGTLYNIPSRIWQRFLFSLNNQAVVAREIPGLHISVSSRVFEVGSHKVRRKSDVPLLPSSERLTRVRVADPTASEIALTKDSKEALAWLLSCVQATPTKPLSDPHLLHCMSAADAMAEGDTVGIGGWLCTKDGLHWFSEVWSMQEVRSVWQQLRKDAQKYIACFETLAQLALLQMAHARLGHRYMSFAMPAGSDNTPTEAGVNKLFSTAWPLSLFLRLVASWSRAHSVVSGKKNVWADELSRDNLHRFRSKASARFSFSLNQLCQPQGITLHPPQARWRENFLDSAVP